MNTSLETVINDVLTSGKLRESRSYAIHPSTRLLAKPAKKELDALNELADAVLLVMQGNDNSVLVAPHNKLMALRAKQSQSI